MDTYLIDSSTVAAAVSELKKGGKHFIITVDVPFPKGITVLGSNSIYSFKGGSFTSATSSTIFLDDCQIFAAAYPIFGKNVSVEGESVINSEVKAEWFRLSENDLDADYINKALKMANGTPVVLESRTYTLLDSIRFNSANGIRQTLICPGTLLIGPRLLIYDTPAIDINTREVSLKINKIEGTSYFFINPDAEPRNYNGVGIRFSVYTENSDIEVKSMSKLNKGFFVQPDTWDDGSATDKPEYGGIQNCSIRFGSISADYCFYIDTFSKAQYINKETGKPVNLKTATNLSQLTLTPRNWFNNNQISGKLMQGNYGIYVLGPNEFDVDGRTVGLGKTNTIDPKKVSNVLAGLKFSNIAFEEITFLPIRLRSVSRSRFLNLNMYDILPDNITGVENDAAPRIDMDNIYDVRISFNSYLVPEHVVIGDDCKDSYLYGEILTSTDDTGLHFDTLGIDTLYTGTDLAKQAIYKSQKFVTNSITPFNMAKNINTADNPTPKYIKDFLPTLNEKATDPEKIDVPVLPSTLNVEIESGKTFNLDLSGLNTFPPCLYRVNATIAQGGTLCFRTSDNLRIENSATSSGVSQSKEFTSSGTYTIQWLSNNVIRITHIQ